ncbi:hypothetical protein ACFWFZ_00940 [Streptomyces sp. NPDC060232]|uniref:hypothetical protein n=1 Tax=Streptomyces sp. NPDC060232 TaxID=3347079 RepID=UPI0036675B67
MASTPPASSLPGPSEASPAAPPASRGPSSSALPGTPPEKVRDAFAGLQATLDGSCTPAECAYFLGRVYDELQGLDAAMKADPKGPGHFPEPIALVAQLDAELGGDRSFKNLKEHPRQDQHLDAGPPGRLPLTPAGPSRTAKGPRGWSSRRRQADGPSPGPVAGQADGPVAGQADGPVAASSTRPAAVPTGRPRPEPGRLSSWSRSTVSPRHRRTRPTTTARSAARRSSGSWCTSKTVFDMASDAEQFTADAVLLLAGRRQLSLDEPLSAFLDDPPA